MPRSEGKNQNENPIPDGYAEMKPVPAKISLSEWDDRYECLRAMGFTETSYGGPLSRHACDGDYRLLHLQFDNSPASLRLWNFLLTEENRLDQARCNGNLLIGTMKDLGTVPVLAYSFPHVTAFYPDGAWWIPCVMEYSAGLLKRADSFGIDESFCPVRAMLGAFESQAHYPIPDLLICSVGAVCDDFSAIAQRLEGMGHPILWWEIPHRRQPERDEDAVVLPGGFIAPSSQVEFVAYELARIKERLEEFTRHPLTDSEIQEGIRVTNRVRRILNDLRNTVYCSDICPLPSLEMLIAEMLAIHFCSDRGESIRVLQTLLVEAQQRIEAATGILPDDAVRVFWVNPVADLRLMNLLEECGGRVCGADFLFTHALDLIPEDIPPMHALACMALADPMVGTAKDRGMRICQDIKKFRSEAVVISRIPGASHCALEGDIIHGVIQSQLDIPVVEIESPPIVDSMLPTLRTRLEALMETVREKRK